jgi:hypothetical protein
MEYIRSPTARSLFSNAIEVEVNGFSAVSLKDTCGGGMRRLFSNFAPHCWNSGSKYPGRILAVVAINLSRLDGLNFHLKVSTPADQDPPDAAGAAWIGSSSAQFVVASKHADAH